MRMDNLNDLFLHGLKDIYDAEHRLVKALGQLAKEARDPENSGLFEDHRAETEEQTGRLEECFELTGAKPRKHACTGMMGILEEQKSFKDEKPAKEMLAAFDMGAALRTEHYEIATYKSLIAMADCLGAADCGGDRNAEGGMQSDESRTMPRRKSDRGRNAGRRITRLPPR